jgi:hypothetical protein
MARIGGADSSAERNNSRRFFAIAAQLAGSGADDILRAMLELIVDDPYTSGEAARVVLAEPAEVDRVLDAARAAAA